MASIRSEWGYFSHDDLPAGKLDGLMLGGRAPAAFSRSKRLSVTERKLTLPMFANSVAIWRCTLLGADTHHRRGGACWRMPGLNTELGSSTDSATWRAWLVPRRNSWRPNMAWRTLNCWSRWLVLQASAPATSNGTITLSPLGIPMDVRALCQAAVPDLLTATGVVKSFDQLWERIEDEKQREQFVLFLEW